MYQALDLPEFFHKYDIISYPQQPREKFVEWNFTCFLLTGTPRPHILCLGGVNEMWTELEVRIWAAVPFAPLLDGEKNSMDSPLLLC